MPDQAPWRTPEQPTRPTRDPGRSAIARRHPCAYRSSSAQCPPATPASVPSRPNRRCRRCRLRLRVLSLVPVEPFPVFGPMPVPPVSPLPFPIIVPFRPDEVSPAVGEPGSAGRKLAETDGRGGAAEMVGGRWRWETVSGLAPALPGAWAAETATPTGRTTWSGNAFGLWSAAVRPEAETGWERHAAGETAKQRASETAAKRRTHAGFRPARAQRRANRDGRGPGQPRPVNGRRRGRRRRRVASVCA